jgi:hypothetical protein
MLISVRNLAVQQSIGARIRLEPQVLFGVFPSKTVENERGVPKRAVMMSGHGLDDFVARDPAASDARGDDSHAALKSETIRLATLDSDPPTFD